MSIQELPEPVEDQPAEDQPAEFTVKMGELDVPLRDVVQSQAVTIEARLLLIVNALNTLAVVVDRVTKPATD